MEIPRVGAFRLHPAKKLQPFSELELSLFSVMR
jgi:hypothetical protein